MEILYTILGFVIWMIMGQASLWVSHKILGDSEAPGKPGIHSSSEEWDVWNHRNDEHQGTRTFTTLILGPIWGLLVLSIFCIWKVLCLLLKVAHPKR